ncbi:hypothetical protein GYH30_048062 [Glycine max]|nr:hypothetical protein GYH30_048062 [Glycine max]
MSSSDGLRARLNGRRQPQEQNEKIDRRDFQNMGGMVEDISS